MRVFAILSVLAGVGMASSLPSQKFLSDKYRPQFHYSISEHWINDPNGMFYLDGEYHLFYQYNPFGDVSNTMHWGHAVSSDLIHWEELGIAIEPDELGFIWSGSAVVDHKNSSGFQTDPSTPAVVAIWTHAAGSYPQQQSIAFSNDKGRTFTKYDGNPVIPNPGIPDFRDPKVFLYDDSTWIMALAGGNKIMFYSSTNLKSWEYLSEFGADPEQGWHTGVWECPDLLRIPYGNDEWVWILLVSLAGGPNGGSVTQYFTGDFDGTRFSSSQFDARWMDWGTDNYAAVSFSNEPKGRSIVMGWMSNWDYANQIPTDGWRGQMTLPRELGLTMVGGQIRLVSKFVDEMEGLISPDEQPIEIISGTQIGPDEIYELTLPTSNSRMKLNLDFDISSFGPSSSIAICFMNNVNQEVCTGLDNGREMDVFLDRTRSGNVDFNDRFTKRATASRIIGAESQAHIHFEIYLDVSAIEVFVDGGTTALTSLFYPDEELTRIEIRHHSDGHGESQLSLISGSVHGLLSIL